MGYSPTNELAYLPSTNAPAVLQGQIDDLSVRLAGLEAITSSTIAAFYQAIANAAAQAITVPPLSTITANVDFDLSSLTPFGNITAKTTDLSRRTDLSAVTRGTRAIVRNTAGSGTFGAAAADYAVLVSASKDNWATALGTAATEGEVDGALFLARQGKKGDVAGILLDVAKRRDTLTATAADESGGGGAIESVMALTNAAGSIYHNVHGVLGFAESAGGLSGGRGHGMWVHAEVGSWYSGYTAQGSGSTGGFLNYFVGAGNGTQADVNFVISSSGSIRQGLSTAYVVTSYDPALNIWSVADEAGAQLIAINRTTKTLMASGGVQIASGSAQVFCKAASYTDTIPTLANGAGGTLATKTISGAAVGDIVTVAVTTADSGYVGVYLKGVVSAANTVTVYVQNLAGGTIGGVSVAYDVKVERFQ